MSIERKQFLAWAFASTSDVLAAADACEKADIPVRLIQRPASMGPTPKAECGTVLRADPQDKQRVTVALKATGLTPTLVSEISDIVAV